jgi:hypothetical protein
MHVWLRRLSVIFGILLTGIAHAADEKTVEYGKYVCITDGAVGLKSKENTTQRYAGVIQMPPGKQKFFATLSRIKKVASNSVSEWIQDGVIQHNPEYCFSNKNIAKLQNEWDSENDILGYEIGNFAQWCLARSAVKLTDVVDHIYYSVGKNIFFGSLGERFWIYNGWRFTWSFDGGVGEHYMMEGRCDLIK